MGWGAVGWVRLCGPTLGCRDGCCAVVGGVALCCVGWWCAVLHCVVSNCA